MAFAPIHGITVKLHELTVDSYNGFNEPVYVQTVTEVENVIVAPASEQEILDTINLTGRKAVYTLGIPKGDTHAWANTIVEFFGRQWRTIGEPTMGIDDMIPLSWNKKVRCESLVEEPESQD